MYKLFDVDVIKNQYTIFFCGISKNCIKTIKSNLDFISSFKEFTDYEIFTVFIDSDSTDGTKKIIHNFSKRNSNSKSKDLDGMESIYTNRIERIVNSRNECLKVLNSTKKNDNIIYIPLDLDIDIFKFTSVEEFQELIEYVIKKNKPNGIFPFSLPYYYDIFALRATNWVNYNSQYWVKRLKKIFKIGSFIFNYIYIFRHQIKPENLFKKNSKIFSAFGGIGIYKLNNNFNFYSLDSKHPEDVSEHIMFNSQFNDLEILINWKIPAPNEHLEYHLLSGISKFKYIFKTLMFDFTK